MEGDGAPVLVRGLRKAPQVAGGIAVVMAVVVLFGWLIGSEVLKGVVPGFGTMKPNTAFGFLTVGGSLWLLSGRPDDRRVWAADTLAVLGLALHGATLAEYLWGWNLGIDTLLFPDPGSSLTPYPGRPSPATATNFSLGALAILLRHRRGPGQTAPTQVLAASMGLIAFTALGAYLLGVEPFYGLAYFVTGMAIHTAATFLLLAIGLLALRQEAGFMRLLMDEHTSGLLARRLVPVTLLLPLVVGFLVGLGRRLDLYDDSFALTVTPLLMFLGFAVILNISLGQVGRFERDRDAANVALQEKEIEQLRQQDAFRVRFLNNAAHELATPLTPLVLQLEILQRSCENGDEQQTRSLASMGRSVERIRRLVQDLVAAARLQGAEVRVEPTEAEIATAVAHCTGRWEDKAGAKGLQWATGLAPARVMVDVDRLEQVLDHLLGNAVKFTDAGSIHVRGDVSDGMYRIAVEDTGRGFDPADTDKLFRPFSQVHDPMQVTDPGSGLGLFICKGIVERHGGTIGIHSDGPGTGVQVWFTLPLATTG